MSRAAHTNDFQIAKVDLQSSIRDENNTTRHQCSSEHRNEIGNPLISLLYTTIIQQATLLFRLSDCSELA